MTQEQLIEIHKSRMSGFFPDSKYPAQFKSLEVLIPTNGKWMGQLVSRSKWDREITLTMGPNGEILPAKLGEE